MVRIGTSGWHYQHWRGVLYPPDLRSPGLLQCYARHFDTVEVNNVFYRLPTQPALESWYRQTPGNFCFALKGSRFITHRKKLLDPEATLQNYLAMVSVLRDKLGPILFQLPPRWQANPARLEEFLHALPGDREFAFEFRDRSWHQPAVYRLLRHHNAAVCIDDWQGCQSPLEFTAGFSYIRFHGPMGGYAGQYSPKAIDLWADRIRNWAKQLKSIYVYFNNDVGGHAVKNAQMLMGSLGIKSATWGQNHPSEESR